MKFNEIVKEVARERYGDNFDYNTHFNGNFPILEIGGLVELGVAPKEESYLADTNSSYPECDYVKFISLHIDESKKIDPDGHTKKEVVQKGLDWMERTMRKKIENFLNATTP